MGPLTIYSYGAMVALAFFVFMSLTLKRAEIEGINKDKLLDLGLILLVSGIIGARLFFVFSNLDFFISNPIEVIMLQHGGLVFYGGFLAALSAAVIFIRLKRLDFWQIADLFAPYIALGHAIGRIGCFLNGCCYGKKAEFLGVHFPEIEGNVWPTQLISSLSLFVLFFVLINLRKKSHYKGYLTLNFFMFYSLGRFCIEFLRGDNPSVFFGLTVAQVISIPIFVISLVMLITKESKWKS